MDESWNFLNEAPECELALVKEASEKCGIQIPSTEYADKMVCQILKEFGLDAEASYEVFLDEICKEQLLSTERIGLEKKEIGLLEVFLAQGIRKMSEEQVRSFVTNFGFSNLDIEKLTLETRARMATEKMFQSRIPNVVSMMFLGIDCSKVFPIDSVNLVYTIKSATACKGILSSILIQIRKEHQRMYDNKLIVEYVDNAFLKGCEDWKKPVLSIIFELYKLHCELIESTPDELIESINESMPESNIIFDESIAKYISSYLGSAAIELPLYIKKKVKLENVQGLVGRFMEILFPCRENEDEAFARTYNKTTKFKSVAFFDYRFPYTQIPPKNITCYYCIPKDEFEQKAVELFLLCHGKNTSCLIDEENLRKTSCECAVIGRKQSQEVFSFSFNNCIKTMNPISIGLEILSQKNEFSIDEIQRLVVEFIKLDFETMKDICKEVEESENLRNSVIRELVMSLTSRIASNK